MDARYLRVKNWGDFQHYRDKEPKWIKLYAKILRDGRFGELDEPVQWQLVRIWMIASQSDRFTRDGDGRRVPVLSYDEKNLRRAISSLKKIPLEMFVREGWLVPVAEDELDDEPLPSPTLGDESRPALDESYSAASPALRVEGRGLELASTASNGSPVVSYVGRSDLPIEHEHMLDKLMRVIGSSADEGTRGVLAAYARLLPQVSLAKVLETTAKQPLRDRARYANGALRSEVEERSAA